MDNEQQAHTLATQLAAVIYRLVSAQHRWDDEAFIASLQAVAGAAIASLIGERGDALFNDAWEIRLVYERPRIQTQREGGNG